MEFNKTTAEAEAHLTHCKNHCNQNRKLCLMNAMMTMTMKGWSNISSRTGIVAGSARGRGRGRAGGSLSLCLSFSF